MLTHSCIHLGHTSVVADTLHAVLGISRTMKNHILAKHTSVRPFVCDTCGKAYAFEWALKLHLKNHTGSFDYSCEHCEYKTNGKQYYESKLIFKQTLYEPFVVHVFSCTVNIIMELS